MKRYKRKRTGAASSAVQLINCKILTRIENRLDEILNNSYVATSAIRAAIKLKESTTPEEFTALLLEHNRIYYEDLRYIDRSVTS